MTGSANIEYFVNPQSIALIGVSSRTGPTAFNILEQILNFTDYQGAIYPVNPRGGEILGVPVYTSVQEIKANIDLAVISTPRTAVPELVRQCAQKGIPAVIVVTQGFSDADDEAGHRMHQQIIDAVQGTNTRVVGPNTLGIVNNFNGFKTSFLNFTTNANPVGFICQSGIFLAAGLDFAGGLGIAIDTGNTADVDFVECMEYLAQHPSIKVINLYLEGLPDGRRFMEVARKITPHKPILVLKAGSSEEGAKAAISHSGSLAGADEVFSAAFEQSGVIRITETNRLADLNRTLYTFNGMSGTNIGIITISGGAGIMVVDAISKYGLKSATFTPETIAKLEQVYPDWMKAGNPADIWPAGMANGYQKIVAQATEAILADPQVDGVIFVTQAYLSPEGDPLNIADIISEKAALYPHKPTALWIFGPHKKEHAQIYHAAGKAVVYDTPEDAAYCLSQLYKYHNLTKNKTYTSMALPQATSTASQTTDVMPVTLNEQALDIIEQAGIPVAPRMIIHSEKEALQAAEKIGYPVVMKVISSHITHKSDVGGVRLNITSADELIKTYGEMMQTIPQVVAGAEIEGFLIQKSVAGGVEVILGGKKDPQFGPVLVYGLGGIYAEIMQDVVFRVAPVTFDEALAMIKETKSYQLISGARGQQPGDMDALVRCIVQLGQLLCAKPEIAEVDINPILVQPQGCIALDARMVVHATSVDK